MYVINQLSKKYVRYKIYYRKSRIGETELY